MTYTGKLADVVPGHLLLVDADVIGNGETVNVVEVLICTTGLGHVFPLPEPSAYEPAS